MKITRYRINNLKDFTKIPIKRLDAALEAYKQAILSARKSKYCLDDVDVHWNDDDTPETINFIGFN